MLSLKIREEIAIDIEVLVIKSAQLDIREKIATKRIK